MRKRHSTLLPVEFETAFGQQKPIFIIQNKYYKIDMQLVLYKSVYFLLNRLIHAVFGSIKGGGNLKSVVVFRHATFCGCQE